MYTCMDQLLIVAKARDDVRLDVANHDEVVLTPSLVSQLRVVGRLFDEFVRQGSCHGRAIDHHVIALLNPANLLVAKLVPLPAP